MLNIMQSEVVHSTIGHLDTIFFSKFTFHVFLVPPEKSRKIRVAKVPCAWKVFVRFKPLVSFGGYYSPFKAAWCSLSDSKRVVWWPSRCASSSTISSWCLTIGNGERQQISCSFRSWNIELFLVLLYFITSRYILWNRTFFMTFLYGSYLYCYPVRALTYVLEEIIYRADFWNIQFEIHVYLKLSQ